MILWVGDLKRYTCLYHGYFFVDAEIFESDSVVHHLIKSVLEFAELVSHGWVQYSVLLLLLLLCVLWYLSAVQYPKVSIGLETHQFAISAMPVNFAFMGSQL